MPQQSIPTIPVSDNEKLMRERFFKSFTTQSELMDKLSVNLLTTELAIPGIYATVLKMLGGDQAIVWLNAAFYITFACWLLALAFTLMALIPKKWEVDPDVLIQDPDKYSEGLGLQDYFIKSAQRKRCLIIISVALFFSGIVSAIFIM